MIGFHGIFNQILNLKNMKLKLLFFITVLTVSASFAQTRIKNKQEIFGTWKLVNSPYIIEGEAIVPPDQTLIIEPGVTVQFKTGEDRDYTIDGVKNTSFDVGFLRVNGSIKAEGTEYKLITFTGDGNTDYWGNIQIDSRSKDISFKYCRIEASYYVRGVVLDTYENATAAISFYNSTGAVQNCLFISNGWTAFNCKEGSSPIFKNNTIYGNNYGIECNSGSAPIITNVILWNNKTSFFVNSGSNPKISYSLIQDAQFSEGVIDKGYNLFGVDPEFVNGALNKFKLRPSSPAYRKGQGGVNMGAL